jgi:hypothetical protein
MRCTRAACTQGDGKPYQRKPGCNPRPRCVTHRRSTPPSGARLSGSGRSLACPAAHGAGRSGCIRGKSSVHRWTVSPNLPHANRNACRKRCASSHVASHRAVPAFSDYLRMIARDGRNVAASATSGRVPPGGLGAADQWPAGEVKTGQLNLPLQSDFMTSSDRFVILPKALSIYSAADIRIGGVTSSGIGQT